MYQHSIPLTCVSHDEILSNPYTSTSIQSRERIYLHYLSINDQEKWSWKNETNRPFKTFQIPKPSPLKAKWICNRQRPKEGRPPSYMPSTVTTNMKRRLSAKSTKSFTGHEYYKNKRLSWFYSVQKELRRNTHPPAV